MKAEDEARLLADAQEWVEHEHNIDPDALLDHASTEHQELARRLFSMMDAETERDPAFCSRCAFIGISLAKVAQFQYFMEIGTDHEKDEIRPFLEDALKERMSIPVHGVTQTTPS